MLFEALILTSCGCLVYVPCADGIALVRLLDSEGRKYVKLLRVRALAPC